jgi:hypothetical protein
VRCADSFWMLSLAVSVVAINQAARH